MQQEKVTVSARIPKEMYTFCLQEYTNISTAINTSLELLRDKEHIQNVNESIQTVNKHKHNDEALQEVVNLKARLEEKDRIFQVNEENQNRIIKEKDDHIETLKKELEVSQETHRNYMVQMQTLINQKAIEAPGAKRWWQVWK